MLLTDLFCLPTTRLLFLSLFPSLSLLAFFGLSTVPLTHTADITQPHSICVKAAQGPLKLGRFPS